MLVGSFEEAPFIVRNRQEILNLKFPQLITNFKPKLKGQFALSLDLKFFHFPSLSALPLDADKIVEILPKYPFKLDHGVECLQNSLIPVSESHKKKINL